jgi:hypothetical protein
MKISHVIGCPLLNLGTSIGANNREPNLVEAELPICNIGLWQEATVGTAEERQWLLNQSGEMFGIIVNIGKTSNSRN